jgi:hypothetical protein
MVQRESRAREGRPDRDDGRSSTRAFGDRIARCLVCALSPMLHRRERHTPPHRAFAAVFTGDAVLDNERKVLFDLRKLLDIRSRWRLLVYGDHSKDIVDATSVEKSIQSLVRAQDDAELPLSFLFVGVPWDEAVDAIRPWFFDRVGGRLVVTRLDVPR